MKYDLSLPEGYKSSLDFKKTEKAIHQVKRFFQDTLSKQLDLMRVTAPLFVESDTGVNDDLNGIEQPVRFLIEHMGAHAEIVHSLAKWKRMALARYDIEEGKGIYTDMNAIRACEVLDNIHSIYVDQWDWEKVVTTEERSLEFLKKTVRQIYDVLKDTERTVHELYSDITPILPEQITFIHAEELEERYPTLSPKEREYEICKEHGAVFLIGIGGALKSGEPHDGRAPDYDDWSTETGRGLKGLNGDILVWHPIIKIAFELSSMGIRVDKVALERQLEIAGKEERAQLLFHSKLLNDELPLSIGGGIGQSRLCMFFLRKAHIGEVQSSLWPDEMIGKCEEHGIFIL